jgi:hypothetical protein
MIENNKVAIVPDEVLLDKTYKVRRVKVMLDSGLAELYEVETRILNQAANRNPERFSVDFIFQLTPGFNVLII